MWSAVSYETVNICKIANNYPVSRDIYIVNLNHNVQVTE